MAFPEIFCTTVKVVETIISPLEASEVGGEKFWRMPPEESYWELIKSGVADMVNTSGRQGGAVTAACRSFNILPSALYTLDTHIPISPM
ncbi:hypothetical protein V6N13_081382 [Hibiscus sabdariffa]